MDLFDPEWDSMGLMFSSDSSTSEDSNGQPKRKRKPTRQYYLDRNSTGAFTVVFKRLIQDPQLFHNYTRMSVTLFEELLLMVAPMVKKETVVMEPMPPNLRLALTLRWLFKMC